MGKQIAVLIFIFLSQLALAKADVVLPFSSFRSQGETSKCWAYSAAFVFETNYEKKTGNVIITDLETDLMYRKMYNLLYKAWHYQADIISLWGQLDQELGMHTELSDILLGFGLPLVNSYKSVATPVIYPNVPQDTLGHVAGRETTFKPVDPAAIIGLEKEVVSVKDQQAFDELVIPRLNRYFGYSTKAETLMMGDRIAVAQVLSLLSPLNASDFMQVGFSNEDAKYSMQSGLLIYQMPAAKKTDLIRESLNNGWAVGVSDSSHGYSIIGYKDNQFLVINPYGSAAWEGDLDYYNNVFFVYQPAVAAIIPATPSDPERVLMSRQSKFMSQNKITLHLIK
jgi:hypothetical protein